jgi:hypothetical protein
VFELYSSASLPETYNIISYPSGAVNEFGIGEGCGFSPPPTLGEA